jgi:putative addiction module component (TIGR02574 family)
MASVSLRDLGLDRLSIEERPQLADAIWDSVVHEVGTLPLPEWQRAELECDRGRSTREVATKFDVSESWVRRMKQERRELNKTAPLLKRRRAPL